MGGGRKKESKEELYVRTIAADYANKRDFTTEATVGKCWYAYMFALSFSARTNERERGRYGETVRAAARQGPNDSRRHELTHSLRRRTDFRSGEERDG